MNFRFLVDHEIDRILPQRLPGHAAWQHLPGHTWQHAGHSLHHASHSAHPSHAAHSAAAGHGRGVLLDLGDDGLGGREQGGHAGGVGDGAADHLQK